MASSTPIKSAAYPSLLVIGIVALVGIVAIYSDQSSSPTGAALSSSEQGIEKALVFGKQCGECALADNKDQPLPAQCAELVRLTTESEPQPVYKKGEAQANAQCCRRRCTGGTFKKCQSTCTSSAFDVFSGRARYGKSAASIPRSSSRNPFE